ncbi:hypothetical protein GCM10016455_27360 [Aliiroseovarius zhejiangensis]|uniref:Chromo domain-containing protein n=1 Tax=Aliiroseovarius zhejiangensis TaxID=1632025 RepID=A0ABQ3J7Q8_9RHOB|nr:hypothetical protein [Aliiroseovarius zhejiangensis]GHF04617.1 hypothetical protein GCM10016455_27360 [Aliiroseovarius zhejiangensis]
MLEYLPKEVREGLDAARKKDLKKKNRLRIRFNEEVFPILDFWDGGFALDAERAPHLRGLVDLYDGSRHLYQCLIIASEEDNGQMKYEFKWRAEAHDKAPLDFAREENAPVALIEEQIQTS